MKQFIVTVSIDSDIDVLSTLENYGEIVRSDKNRIEFQMMNDIQHSHISDEDWMMQVANMISILIVNHMEVIVLQRILSKQGTAYEEHEVQEIIQFCQQLLVDAEASLSGSNPGRQSQIRNELYLYLQTNSNLNVEGFVHFRLKKYMRELHDVVEEARNEFILNEQYQEFIALLKYFVYFQDTKIPEVHLIHQGSNKFQLLDGNFQQLDISDSKDVIVETVDRELNYEDMVVSALITASPKEIYIHTVEPDTTSIKTIQQIFEGRTWICTCCKLCKPGLGERKAERST